MTFIISSVALVFCGALLQISQCNVLNPYDPYSNPSLTELQNEAQYQTQQALENNVAYQNLRNNPTYQAIRNNQALNEAITQNNPLFNYKDILSYPPYATYCDCDCSPYINQYIVDQLNQIADQYNQRNCDIQQLYLIIDSIMPTLPDQPYRMNMIESLAKGLYDEQARRQLAYLPEYPGFCNSIYPDAIPTLSKRSPNTDLPSTLIPQSSPNSMAYYYNLNYLMEKIMPDLSPQFKQDIKDSVYMNTRVEELGQAPELIRRLKSNLRVTVSQMYDYTPMFY